MRTLFIIACGALLAACTHRELTPYETEGQLDRQFDGRPANHFFESFGLPAGQFERPDGTRSYRWVSIDPYPPERPHYESVPVPGGGHYAMLDTFSGYTEPTYCELRVYADRNDNIDGFAVAVDSMGKYSASRCSEIFSIPNIV